MINLRLFLLKSSEKETRNWNLHEIFLYFMYKLFVDFVDFHAHFFALLTDALYAIRALYKAISQRWQPRWLNCIVTFTCEQTAYNDSFLWIILLLIIWSLFQNKKFYRSIITKFITHIYLRAFDLCLKHKIQLFVRFTANQLRNCFQLFWLMHVKKGDVKCT